MFRYIVVQFVFVLSATLLACAKPVERTPTPDPQAFRTPHPTVQAEDEVNLIDWQYLPPWELDGEIWVSPAESDVFTAKHYEGRVQWRDDGFDLSWGNFYCSTAPTLHINADATVDFWPGELIGEDCQASEELHKFVIQLQTDVPPAQWQFTLHPPQR